MKTISYFGGQMKLLPRVIPATMKAVLATDTNSGWSGKTVLCVSVYTGTQTLAELMTPAEDLRNQLKWDEANAPAPVTNGAT